MTHKEPNEHLATDSNDQCGSSKIAEVIVPLKIRLEPGNGLASGWDGKRRRSSVLGVDRHLNAYRLGLTNIDVQFQDSPSPAPLAKHL